MTYNMICNITRNSPNWTLMSIQDSSIGSDRTIHWNARHWLVVVVNGR